VLAVLASLLNLAELFHDIAKLAALAVKYAIS
jgi:hypothetical protein